MEADWKARALELEEKLRAAEAERDQALADGRTVVEAADEMRAKCADAVEQAERERDEALTLLEQVTTDRNQTKRWAEHEATRAEAAEARVAEMENANETALMLVVRENLDLRARLAVLDRMADAAEAYVAAIDSAVNNPADFLGSIEREKQALESVRAALRAAARGT